jgi:hypothetical protein
MHSSRWVACGASCIDAVHVCVCVCCESCGGICLGLLMVVVCRLARLCSPTTFFSVVSVIGPFRKPRQNDTLE